MRAPSSTDRKTAEPRGRLQRRDPMGDATGNTQNRTYGLGNSILINVKIEPAS